jgi:hypothetical protein
MRDVAGNTTMNWSNLVYRFAPQLFRLALFITGNRNAALQRMEQSYRALPEGSTNPEADLIRGLLPRRYARWSWRMKIDADEAARAGMALDRATALLRLLGRYTPAQRLVIGLALLRGMAVEDIAVTLRDDAVDAAGVLQRFRLDAAAALGMLPPAADPSLLLEIDQWLDGRLSDENSLELRRMLLEDEDTRALRDALQQTRRTIEQALPSLFAATLTDEQLEQVVEAVAPQPAPASGKQLVWPSALLGAVVLAIVAAIIFGPHLLSQTGANAQTPQRAADVIEAAIHRFDQPPLHAGVLYERYQVQLDDQQALLERRYDYATPNRMVMRVLSTDANQPPRAAISSDGKSLIQYRYEQQSSRSTPAAVDVHVTPSEAQATLPVLRSFFNSTSLFLDTSYAVDLSALYLGQARQQGATSLGEATFLDRPAYLLSYQAPQLPTRHDTTGQPVRVVLTIDRATYALLDVAVIPVGAAESTTSHPWHAQAFEMSDTAPDSAFQLPSTGQVAERQGLMSPHAPTIAERQTLSLAQAQRIADPPLLLPEQLPSDTMLGLALRLGRWGADRNDNNNIGIFYEGEFQSLVLLPHRLDNSDVTDLGPEQHVGNYRYRFVKTTDPLRAVAAEVYRADGQGEQVNVIFLDSYATQAEREAQLTNVIKSLTPVTMQNLPALESRFPHGSSEQG